MSKTINTSEQTKLVVKKSRFLGYIFPINDEDEANQILKQLWKEYPDASHICYAYKINNGRNRYSDDGEPSNTAGIHIFNAVEKHELTNVLVAIVRYFGGIKLGPGGLVKSYRESAEFTIETATLIEYVEYTTFTIDVYHYKQGIVINKFKQHQINYKPVYVDDFKTTYEIYCEKNNEEKIKKLIG